MDGGVEGQRGKMTDGERGRRGVGHWWRRTERVRGEEGEGRNKREKEGKRDRWGKGRKGKVSEEGRSGTPSLNCFLLIVHFRTNIVD
jgi:hypothetical protein